MAEKEASERPMESELTEKEIEDGLNYLQRLLRKIIAKPNQSVLGTIIKDYYRERLRRELMKGYMSVGIPIVAIELLVITGLISDPEQTLPILEAAKIFVAGASADAALILLPNFVRKMAAIDKKKQFATIKKLLWEAQLLTPMKLEVKDIIDGLPPLERRIAQRDLALLTLESTFKEKLVNSFPFLSAKVRAVLLGWISFKGGLNRKIRDNQDPQGLEL